MTTETESNSTSTQNDAWLAVDPAYLPYLRIKLSIANVFPLIACVAAAVVSKNDVFTYLATFGIVATVMSLLWCNLQLAPRRYKRLQYCLRELDINLQSGYLFWKSVSVSINRVQHVEVDQGPIQRKLGIAVLSVYTAGSTGSDMKIPGLLIEDANAIKSRLLNAINNEEPEDDAE